MNIRNLNSKEENSLTNTMYQVFSYEEFIPDSDYFKTYVMSEEKYSPSNVKVVVNNSGKILSHMVIQEREAYAPEKTLKIGGISLVGTLETERRKGYVTKLLDVAIKDMKKRGYDASMLFTNNPFFKKTPYKPLKQKYVIIQTQAGKSGGSAKNLEDLGISTVKELLQNSPIQELYESFSEGKRFLLKRPDSYWENRLFHYPGFQKDNFWFFLNRDHYMGYAIFDIKNSLIDIKEAAWSGDTLNDILIKASQLAKENKLEKIGMRGDWLEQFSPTQIISERDGKFFEEDLMMLSLKENVKIPNEAILFWETDHF